MKLVRRLLFVLTQPRRALDRLTQRRYEEVAIAPGIVRKNYGSYEEYLGHQREKLDRRGPRWLADHEAQYRRVLRTRLEKSGLVTRGMRVLCLAARLGGEVRAFRDLGAFAFGIDLNPGRDNPYVAYGDFHALECPDGAVDLVFTNSLDHSYDLHAVLSEVRRVLRPGGWFVTEIVRGVAEGVTLGYYDAASWQHVDDVLAAVRTAGFAVTVREPIEFPGGREWVVATLTPAGPTPPSVPPDATEALT